jgi:hypothetical protein
MIKKILLYLWQLPQNLLTIIIFVYHKIFLSKRFLESGTYIFDNEITDVRYYLYSHSKPNKYMGFNLGNKTFMYYDNTYKDKARMDKMVDDMKKHEFMHCIQSQTLG